MNSVLVTGADGFIGRALVEHLVASDFKVVKLGSGAGDVSCSDTWARLPRAAVVVHLAAKSSVPKSWQFPGEFVKSNCQGTSNALAYCQRNKAKLIFLSSYMYGDAGSNAISETAPTIAKNPYALTKQFCENLCDIYRHNFAVDCRVLRPFNVYGPGQGRDFLIPKILFEARTSGEICVKDLEPRRDFIYIDDVVRVIVAAIKYCGPHNVFNVGTGRSSSVLDVIKIVEKILEKKVNVVSENVRRPGEIMDSVADVSLANRELGWVPRFSLSDGLSKMLTSL